MASFAGTASASGNREVKSNWASLVQCSGLRPVENLQFASVGTKQSGLICSSATKCRKIRAMASPTVSAPKREKDPKKRIVITGMGLVSVFGSDIDTFYNKLLEGESGIGLIDRFDASKFSVRFGAQIRDFSSKGYIDGKNDQCLDDCWRYCLVSGRRALDDANLGPQVLENMDRTKIGVVVGSGMGGITTLSTGVEALIQKGYKKINPFFCFLLLFEEKMNGGPSGFNNAPVTRAFVIACALFTVFFGIQGRFIKLGLSYEDIFLNFRLWRLIVSGFAFSSAPELMFGLYLLYYFRLFERQIGSNKYSVFKLFSITISFLFEVLTLALLKDPAMKLTSGPYGLIFASFVPFYFDIPISTRFRVFGVHFSDKSFIYLAGLQLLLSSWKSSILPGICGILAGSLYRLNFFRIRKAKFPESVASFFLRLSFPSTGNPPAAPSRNILGSAPSYAGRQVERNYPFPVPSTIEPPEDSIATLVSMGFDRNSAGQALVQARNDINVATNILLEAQSH